jgi:tetratricopeptide (TPR) repeat protein
MPKSVVIVGQLASMKRAEAVRVIELSGAEFSERLTAATSLVVVGSRGPQLQRSGRPSIQMARVLRLIQEGAALEVWPEEQWLRSVGLTEVAAGVRKRFTASQMAEMLEIPRARIDRWLAAGLVHPVEASAGIPLFEFTQVNAVRSLAELIQSGISLTRVCRAVARLSQWLPSAGLPLAELCLSEEIGRLVVRTPAGRLAEPTGQLLMEFDADDHISAVSLVTTESEADAFRRAVECEDERPLESAAIYMRLIAERGPNATLAFNLGNALYAADDPAGALAQYRHATEMDPQHAGAWNNLANVLAELDRPVEAIEAYRRALALDSQLADARFNLAQTLVEIGRADEAMLQWQAYLAADSDSTWAAYARERLESTRP